MRLHKAMTLSLGLLALLMAFSLAAATEAESKPAAPAEKVVNVDFRDVHVEHALRLIFHGTPYTFVLPPDAKGKQITLSLKPLPFSEAVAQMAKAAGLTYERKGNVWTFSAAKPEAEQTMNVSFKEAPLAEALRILFRDTIYSFVLLPGADKGTQVTLQLQEVKFSSAVALAESSGGTDL